MPRGVPGRIVYPAPKEKSSEPGRRMKVDRYLEVITPSGETLLMDAVELRRMEVMEYIGLGKSSYWIKDNLSKKYNVTISSITNDITIYNKAMIEYVGMDKKEIIAEHLTKYDVLYRKCMESKEYETAVKVLAGKEKLMKMHAEISPITINQLSIGGYTNEQLIKMQEIISDGSGDN
jgi:hypothetical protein